MLNIPGHPDLKKIVVLNSKGGSGKSTLATNIVSMLVSHGQSVALMDFDPQGSAMRWLQKRDPALPEVPGIAAFEHDTSMTRSFRLRVPDPVRYLVVDTPAALPVHELVKFTRGAHALILPVLPSDIDIHAVSRLIADLLLVAKVSRRMGRLGVVANRVRENTLSYRQLERFLDRLSIARIGELRDSQNYVYASEHGIGIHEMPKSRVRKDLEQWTSLRDWLALRLETPLTARDLHVPDKSVEPPANESEFSGKLVTGVPFRRRD
ncbi:MAG TPA: ParA family protein [Chromatiales bacterium]|nr:ParA family protein [Chromatiales bacterium]